VIADQYDDRKFRNFRSVSGTLQGENCLKYMCIAISHIIFFICENFDTLWVYTNEKIGRIF